MVRFTLKDGRSSSSIKLDMSKEDSFSVLREIASDYWGAEEMIFLNGYDILRGDTIGEVLNEGDVIDMVPLPKGF